MLVAHLWPRFLDALGPWLLLGLGLRLPNLGRRLLLVTDSRLGLLDTLDGWLSLDSHLGLWLLRLWLLRSWLLDRLILSGLELCLGALVLWWLLCALAGLLELGLLAHLAGLLFDRR